MRILAAVHSPFAMWRIPARSLEELRRRFPQHTFVHASDPDDVLRAIAEADVVLSSHVSADQLAAARRLRWIQSSAAGIGGMLYPAMLASPVILTNARGLAADAVAEHVLAMTLAVFRQLPLAWRRQADRVWAQDEMSTGNRTIRGSRVLVIGLGAIGTSVAAAMHALGAHVSAIRRNTAAGAAPGVLELGGPADLPRMLPEADIVVLTAPQTSETRSLIGERELAAMKPDAVLVNVSRGKLVDESALAAALANGRPGAAALDVFAREPLAPESPLWHSPRVLITPHTAGALSDHWDRVVGLFARNLERFEAGQPLINVVDKAAGY